MSNPQELLNVLEDTAALLIKTQSNLKKCPKARLTKCYVELRLKSIEEYWCTFKINHQNLVKIVSKDKRSTIPYFVNEDFFKYEELYLTLQTELQELLQTFTVVSDNNATQFSTSSNQLVRLPRIELQKFSGNYEDWATFQDLFRSLVHDNGTISDVQKLHYLKTSVTGEAQTLLKHIQVTHQNYEKAWNILEVRYGNKRLILNAVLKKLFNMRKITSQSSTQIKYLLDTTSDCLNNLQNLEISVNSWDPIIIYLVTQKLDSESHKDWEEHAYNDESNVLPTWTDLKKFLQSKYRTLELVASSSTRDKPVKERSFHIANVSEVSTNLSSSSSQSKSCPLCKDNHTLCHCKEFTKLQPLERGEYVKKNNLCFNCLATGHSFQKCRLQMSCRVCKRRHHSLLHRNQNSDAFGTSEPKASHHSVEETEEQQVNTVIASHYSSKRSTNIALLATAIVPVRNEHNHTIVLRALVDQGSQAAFLSEKAAQLLNLTKQSTRGSIIGVGSSRMDVDHLVQFQVGSRWDANFKMDLKAYVMSKQLTTHLPSKAVTVNNWTHLDGLNLADPSYHTPGPIDLLLGVKEYAQIVQQSLIKGPPGSPCAQNTNLGWILFGEIGSPNLQNESFLVLHHQVDIDDMLKSLWEIDTDNKRKLTIEEKQCEQIYEKTHKRAESGRYIVKLPLINTKCLTSEGNTKEIAEKRFLMLERKFRKSPELKDEYIKVINNYIEQGHIEKVPEEEKCKPAVYLPHHAIVRNDKESSKTRVVFDASCQTTLRNGRKISLNDEMLVGPQIQDELRNILIRWRMKRIAFMADIQQMYRQILVAKEDADLQRIIWRPNENEQLEEYRILRVTFGTASAPYLAVRTLQQVAKDEGKDNPNAVHSIQNNFYMDDWLDGDDEVTNAISLANEVTNILQKGGFHLTKWSSNNIDFMKNIKEENRSAHARINLNLDGIVKALGIVWNLNTDTFQYNLITLTSDCPITKRSILSDIQKLFDPLGWIAPSTILAKILVQKLWLEKLAWDEIVSVSLQEEWKQIKSDFLNVNNIQIERWFGTTQANKAKIQLHGYSDASIKAYAAAVYIRTETQDHNISTRLIAARTRVAPLKTISLPRLELCGAVLLSNLMKQVGQAMNIPTSDMYAWTDSTIVLAWLSGEPNRWKTYVANRVVEITENLESKHWHHVQSSHNPADLASRGVFLCDLKSCDLWWKGPAWLSEREINLEHNQIESTDLERKEVKLIQVSLNIQEDCQSLIMQFDQFDNLRELIKTIAFCRRFLNFKRISQIEKNFTTEELEKALIICIKLVQANEYSEEIERIKNNKPMKTYSNIKTLNPYLDEDGVLRVGGRLRHSNLDENTKHPIILGHKNKLVPLIVADAHKQTLHGGVQLMLSFLRRYWIIRAKGIVKNCIHKCLICAKQRAVARTQIMGDLPKERVTPARAFLHSGVDFAGPFQISMSRARGTRTQKAYVSLFVCLSTKAIHLELVADLTSEAFIAAFKRFVSRRGKCSDIWSDQGRTFIGAEKELRSAWQDASLDFAEYIPNTLALEGTQWHFIPAYSPNFGGLWEINVKALKHHLKRILTTTLTFEEMTTILCQIEACLNSRPLCPIDDSDPDSIEPLTPGHFLIGEALTAVPYPSLTDIPMHQLSRWQYTQKLTGDIWRRWQQEYLTRLQQRPKWIKKNKEFEVGDIVLIKMDNLPPGAWAMGRIVEKHPGEDSHTRVYSVRSGGSVTRRSVSKLCPLPIDTNIDDCNV